jgi:hypothetical protein
MLKTNNQVEAHLTARNRYLSRKGPASGSTPEPDVTIFRHLAPQLFG